MIDIEIWLTSDLHIGHDQPFIWQERGFKSVQEMNEEIVKRYNEIVHPEDIVYLLGDIIMGDSDETIKYLDRLVGNKIIVRGNHDSEHRISLYKAHGCQVVDALYLKYRKYNFYLTHYPCITSNYDKDEPLRVKMINVCGHYHTKNKFEDVDRGLTTYHVEVDAHNCYPVNIDKIIQDLKERIK